MFAIGGSGAGGGTGGTVTVDNSGSIVTYGPKAIGVFAQSVGGGGGNGGDATAVGAFFSLAIGGDGDSGGQGGVVQVKTGGALTNGVSSVTTTGNHSTGIFAQSVGGGGGNGGGSLSIAAGAFGALSIGIGGTGGGGGLGGDVTLEANPGTSLISTSGDNSGGLFAQSVGGGGGNGGYATSVALSAGPVAGSVSIGVGGSGGSGGNGGQVVAGNYLGEGFLADEQTGFRGSIATTGDYSTGYFIQSVGGGGGNGGSSVTVPVSISAGASGSVGVSVGGNGEFGGAGGLVKGGFSGSIQTGGFSSPALIAQSIGGGGGNGGASTNVSVALSGGASGSVGVSLGGDGDGGGNGGDVYFATGEGLIETTGDSSTAINIQSVGGGGGNGGNSVDVTVSASATASGSVSVGLGGEGAKGGIGGNVTAYMESDVSTSGYASTGVLVQSVGGGGGNGGFNVGVAFAGSGTVSGAVGVGLGGNGGTAAQGGQVEAVATGSINTTGDDSPGFVAQSIGGGGGNGGFNVTAALSGSGTASGTVGVGLGGDGAGGGQGGNVTASTGTINDSTLPLISTKGENSTAILAQSIGGGGGNGGFNVTATFAGAGTAAGTVGVGLGGNGAGGGDAQNVILNVQNNIITGDSSDFSGSNSPAIVAQSIGGGGGNGSFNVTAGLSGAGSVSGTVGIGLGGDGAKGGNSADVNLAVTSNYIDTYSNNSPGFIAQSIGGGGGNGGFNVTAGISGAGTAAGSVSVGLGGAAGGGGDALGTVSAQMFGDGQDSSRVSLTTFGNDSSGVIAQSIGGGGGNGGFNISGTISGAGSNSGGVTVGLGGAGGDGGNSGSSELTNYVVDNYVLADITTDGERSKGIFVQSLGGGGGNGGFNISGSISGSGSNSAAISVGVGGSGGLGGNASGVKNYAKGTIITRNDESTAVLVQSVGGGGGNGGFNVGGSISGAGSNSAGISVGIGGSGGGGGHSGAVVTSNTLNDGIVDQLDVNSFVSVDNSFTGFIETYGDDSKGVVAQSLGGGGGNGGFTVELGISGAGSNSGAINVGIGGSGGDGGHSSAVRNIVNADITTRGDDSTAVLAQSVGGGGGNGGFTVSAGISGSGKSGGTASVAIGGSGGGGGDAGGVTNTVTGSITTGDAADVNIGANSDGVVAQSLGGGGGNGGFSVSGGLNLSSDGSGSVAVGVGGSGGDGGNSGNVVNSYEGDLFTYGPTSMGVLAQSVGGGGGNGGFNVSGSVAFSANSSSAAAAVGIGGFGGGGGESGDVTNTVIGRVQTLGDNPDPDDTETPFSLSGGVITQSLGGGGGNGGFNVSGEITGSSKSTGGLAFGLGGFGGHGGDSKAAFSQLIGSVQTSGDYAPAIATQSVGGSGGRGGFNVSGSLSLTKESSGAVGIGIGGFGGGGGDVLGVVTSMVESDLTNETLGNFSPVVFAQSLGGGGGNGGFNVSGSASLSGKSGASVALGVGGFGGGAGNANEVIVDVSADLRSVGRSSDGLIAQSVGGGGGNGAINVSGSLAFTTSGEDSTKTTSASIGVGGFGGGGGDAQTVDVDYSGSIYAVPDIKSTENPDIDGEPQAPTEYGSNGLIAQSVGGSGGSGGLNVSGGLSYAGKDADGNALMIGIGGFGGDGGDAGDVILDIYGDDVLDIRAYGPGRSAVNASSIGGAGGNGGLNISGGITSDSPLIVGIGGFGGDGGSSKDVTATVSSNLYTDYEGYLVGEWSDYDEEEQAELIRAGGLSEETSAGLLAQSIGGGGGNGGLNVSGGIAISKDDNSLPSLMFGLGGYGGDGNISGDVNATHNGEIAVTGAYTHGILAQSIAGGGGNGGLNITGLLTPAFGVSETNAGKTDLSIVSGIGGFAGSGAVSGDVYVYSSLQSDSASTAITTAGNYSRGIFAQSIGGGGGTGGISGSFVGGRNTSPLMLGIGGFGGGGGNSGKVEVYRGSTDFSADPILTSGIGSIGIEASSIGGGGGDAGWNIALGVSKSIGGSANDGKGTADGSNRPHPSYEGIDDEVFTAYDNVLAELENRQAENSSDANEPNKSSAFAAQIMIGGNGGEAGNGESSLVNNFSDIHTLGKQSHGILSQSIGGGGGNATVNLGVTYQGGYDSSKGFNLAIGGAPGDGGLAQSSTVTHRGNISTEGYMSYGILSQSIGGGGGNVGFESVSSNKDEAGKLSVSLGRRGGSGGNSGVVMLDSDGIVSTLGDRSYGLLAQSVGNGGGNSGTTTVTGVGEETNKSAKSLTVSIGLEGGEGGFGNEVSITSSGSVSTSGLDSHAVFAQSIGGGGGNGGSASADPSKGSAFAFTMGGTGGEGGYGSKVTVTNTAALTTLGVNSLGILAQSIGGSGGTGGSAKINPKAKGAVPYLGSQTTGYSFQVTMGGTGGAGMYAEDVDIFNTGSISTYSINNTYTFEDEDYADQDPLTFASHAILAQSIGGGGGTSGTSENIVENADYSDSLNGKVSLGGDGGEGGYSGNVEVQNIASLSTQSDYSVGIFGQSIGGGGGNSDFTAIYNNGSAKTDSSASGLFSFSAGGSGGAGNYSDEVNISNLSGASIFTEGFKAYGILAMSVGGGGGNGSNTISMNRDKGSGSTAPDSVAVSLGGDGGVGGYSGDVTVFNDGIITTLGDESHAIIAQSIAGGGGNGGFSLAASPGSISDSNYNVTASLGGSGGTGNIAGDVTVVNDLSGLITTYGEGAYGIYAQSVGGGGGSGGGSIALSKNVLSNPLSLSSLLTFALGGDGGDGGDGGNVLVQNNGQIISYGDNSYGIYAQSVGAGGGDVGVSISSPLWTVLDLTISSLAGAREGTDGLSGSVVVESTGDIVMLGDNSSAIFAQRVDGGGGNIETFMDISQAAQIIDPDGVNVPEVLSFKEQVTNYAMQLGSELFDSLSIDFDPNIDVYIPEGLSTNFQGNIAALGDSSTAFLAQNIGGGGGQVVDEVIIDDYASYSGTITLGAIETDNSPGGSVVAERTGDITVVGADSRAAKIQSIGGGGGSYFSNIQKSGSTSLTGPQGTVESSVILGADPSLNNPGGDISINWEGDITQTTDFVPVVSIQSIGAGGGDAFFSGSDMVEVTIGATDGSDGDGGVIDIENRGSLLSGGYRSNGFVIQSIGGGGGSTYTDLPSEDVTVITSDWNEGSGSDVTFSQFGDITLSGDESVGVVVQSLGGGGGLVDRVFANSSGGRGDSGNISFDFSGNLLGLGQDNIGFLLQSQSSYDKGDISVAIADSSVVSLDQTGVAIQISGGSSNSLLNSGIVSAISSEGRPDGYAFVASDGNDSVSNLAGASFSGNVNLGAGKNSLVLASSATGYLGEDIVIGNGSFLNSGTVYPGADYIYDVNIDGSYIQDAQGSLAINLDYVDDSLDRLSISRDAVLNGSLDVSLRGIEKVKPGQRNLVFATTGGSILNEHLELDIYPSIVAQYAVKSTSDIAYIDTNIDFAYFGGLNKNQSQIGEYINEIQLQGSDPSLSALVTSLFSLTSASQLKSAYDSLSPEPYSSAPQLVSKSAEQFVKNMFSCSVLEGPYRFISEGECGWIGATGFTFNRDSTYRNFGFYSSSYGLSGGAQVELGNDFYLGISAAQTRSNTSYSSVSARLKGLTNQAGLALKKVFGASKVALGFGGGLTKSQAKRTGVFPDNSTARSRQTLNHLSSTLAFSHDFDYGDWYLRPSLDLSFTQVWMGGFSESGAGALNLRVKSFEQSSFDLTPMLEVGGEVNVGNALVRPSLSVGFSQALSNSGVPVSARFEGAPRGVDSFEVVDYADSGAVQLGAGLDIVFANGVFLDLDYLGGYSANTDLHSGSIKLTVPF